MHFDLSKFLRALSSISNDTLKLPYGINCNAKVDSVDEVSKVTDIYKNGRVTHMYISINNINETLKFKQGFSYTSSPHINLYKLNNKRIPTTSIYLNNKENVYNQKGMQSLSGLPSDIRKD